MEGTLEAGSRRDQDHDARTAFERVFDTLELFDMILVPLYPNDVRSFLLATGRRLDQRNQHRERWIKTPLKLIFPDWGWYIQRIRENYNFIATWHKDTLMGSNELFTSYVFVMKDGRLVDTKLPFVPRHVYDVYRRPYLLGDVVHGFDSVANAQDIRIRDFRDGSSLDIIFPTVSSGASDPISIKQFFPTRRFNLGFTQIESARSIPPRTDEYIRRFCCRYQSSFSDEMSVALPLDTAKPSQDEVSLMIARVAAAMPNMPQKLGHTELEADIAQFAVDLSEDYLPNRPGPLFHHFW